VCVFNCLVDRVVWVNIKEEILKKHKLSWGMILIFIYLYWVVQGVKKKINMSGFTKINIRTLGWGTNLIIGSFK
jgi:hypothetical protein